MKKQQAIPDPKKRVTQEHPTDDGRCPTCGRLLTESLADALFDAQLRLQEEGD
jgi:hypothetical protein